MLTSWQTQKSRVERLKILCNVHARCWSSLNEIQRGVLITWRCLFSCAWVVSIWSLCVGKNGLFRSTDSILKISRSFSIQCDGAVDFNLLPSYLLTVGALVLLSAKGWITISSDPLCSSKSLTVRSLYCKSTFAAPASKSSQPLPTRKKLLSTWGSLTWWPK